MGLHDRMTEKVKAGIVLTQISVLCTPYIFNTDSLFGFRHLQGVIIFGTTPEQLQMTRGCGHSASAAVPTEEAQA